MKLNEQIDLSFITKKTWTQNEFFKIFCYIMFGGICLFLLSLLILGFERWRYLFYFLVDPSDSFMDFFSPIYWVQFKNTYSVWFFANYLAFPYLIFYLFSCIIPNNILLTSPYFIRSNIYGLISLLVFLCVSIIPLIALIFKNKYGNSKEKMLFSFFIVFSAPFLYSIERGNIIFIALFFMMFFVFYYDSKKRYLRKLSLFFLACATVIKVYPAAVGILLLKDKRYKDIFLFGFYILCLAVVPFFFYNGLNDMILMVGNMSGISSLYSKFGYGYSVNVYITLKMLVYAFTDHEFIFLNILFSYVPYLCLLLGAFISYFTSKKWKSIALVCLLMILVPSISWTYALLFMIPPLILFLNDQESKNFEDLIYLILFCLIFMLNIPMLAPIIAPYGCPVLMDNFCARLACLVMFIMLCRDGIKDYYVCLRNAKEDK